MSKKCCAIMDYWSSNHCPVHDSPFECPDWLIIFNENEIPEKKYGIVIHDGGQSFVPINYCPWCGSALFSADKPKT